LRILLTGRNGQVGWELARALSPLGELVALDHAGLDLAVPDRIRPTLREIKPEVIVNAAAYTAVDRAESESEAAFAINARAPGILAEEARRLDALLVHYSTDYVFDGTKAEPYTEDDAPNPINVYGRSKLDGERAIRASGARHWIFRTSWVYAPRGNNFFLTMLRLAREGKPLRVVADQFGAPTSAAMLARATALALSPSAHALSTRTQALSTDAQPLSGIYHMSAAGRTSWHGFACAILRETGIADPVTAIAAADYPAPARRPANSLLDGRRLAARFDIRMPDWETGLREAVAALTASS
jgi:dTDP-4-dehydrorhamnose reductase